MGETNRRPAEIGALLLQVLVLQFIVCPLAIVSQYLQKNTQHTLSQEEESTNKSEE